MKLLNLDPDASTATITAAVEADTSSITLKKGDFASNYIDGLEGFKIKTTDGNEVVGSPDLYDDSDKSITGLTAGQEYSVTIEVAFSGGASTCLNGRTTSTRSDTICTSMTMLGQFFFPSNG